MAILARKLGNAIKKENLQVGLMQEKALVVKLKNIRLNGDSIGCSGFIANLETGKVVYVNTEESGNAYRTSNSMRYLYRTATSFEDYTGGTNRFADNMNSLTTKVLQLLDA